MKKIGFNQEVRPLGIRKVKVNEGETVTAVPLNRDDRAIMYVGYDESVKRYVDVPEEHYSEVGFKVSERDIYLVAVLNTDKQNNILDGFDVQFLSLAANVNKKFQETQADNCNWNCITCRLEKKNTDKGDMSFITAGAATKNIPQSTLEKIAAIAASQETMDKLWNMTAAEVALPWEKYIELKENRLAIASAEQAALKDADQFKLEAPAQTAAPAGFNQPAIEVVAEPVQQAQPVQAQQAFNPNDLPF